MLKKHYINLLFLLGFCLLPVSAKSSTDLGRLPLAAQTALKKVLDGQSVKSLSPLQGGFSSSKLYMIKTEKQSYVLRLMDLQRSFADREREIKCLQIASQENVAPKVFQANARDGIILMEFVENMPLSKEERSPKILLPRLSHILKKIHQSPPFPKVMSVQEKIRNITSDLARKKIKLPSFVSEALVSIQKIEIPLQNTVTLSPCHNDLNPNNILFTRNQIKIIDWEGAGMGDPYFDLATVALFFIFDPKDEDLYLKSYFGTSPTVAQKNRLYLMKQVSLCFYGLALLGASHSEHPLSSDEIDALPSFSSFLEAIGEGKEKLSSPHTLKKFAFVAFKQAFNNMKTKEFSEALEAISF